MKLIKRYPIIFGLLFSINAHSQCIEGTVKSTSGSPVAYATIYVPAISKGTTSNIEGKYKLELPKGEHDVTIRYLGYKTKEIKVSCNDASQSLDIILEEQTYKIPEVRILASGEDPAYSIMRKAISMSYYYLNQIEEYNCRVYVKGSGKVNSIPLLLKKTFNKEGIDEGKRIIVENITDLHFKLPDILEQTTISMRSTMNMDEISPMNYIAMSLYKDVDGVISPLSRDAFSYYKFQLVSSFYDQDYLIHRIKIIPRREGYDLYSGFINIVEGFWHLHSTELQLEQKMFKVKINQVYTPIENDVWMPVSHDFDIEAKMLGIEVVFKYVASVSDYKIKLNSKLDHSSYISLLADSKEYANEIKQVEQEQQKEIWELIQKEDLTKKEAKKLRKLIWEEVKKTVPERELERTDNYTIEDSAALRTVNYWDSIRPIPLAPDELESYKIKDSVQLRMETDSTFKDSINTADSKFSWKKVLLGGTFDYKNGHSFRYKGLVNVSGVNFNTVDGLKYGMEFNYSFSNDSGMYFNIRNNADYAFARERMTSNISMYYRYNGLKRAYITLAGGRKTSDFDSESGMSEDLNMITTLMLKENYLKLYQKDYFQIGHGIDIKNGFELYAGFEYAQRKELSNHSNYCFYNPFKKDYTSNIPINKNNILVEDHNASIFQLRLEYTPQYYYRISKGVKRMLYSNYPTFTVDYKKGIKRFLDSDVDFDKLEVTIEQGLSIRRLGGLSYTLSGGSFLNSNTTYFADYKHFGTNTPFLIGSSERSMLRLPNYYDYSTNNNYFEANIKLESDRLLLKRLPILNKTLMREAISANYLSTTGRKPYYEVGYSLNQIFLMFSVEVFVGFEGAKHEYTGLKIGIPFVGRNGTSVIVGG